MIKKFMILKVTGILLLTLVLGMQTLMARSLKKNVQERSKILAKIDLEDNGKIEFIEVIPGELLVFATQGSRIKLDTLNQSPIAIFERYARKKAPRSLIRALKRSKKINERTPEDYENDLPLDSNPELTQPESTTRGIAVPNYFATTYYYNNDTVQNMTYKGLRLNRTGLYRIQRKCLSMGMIVQPYRGTVRYKLQWQYNGKWRTFYERILPQGTVYNAYIGGSWRYRRAEVTESTNDGFHVVFYGDPPLTISRWHQHDPYDIFTPSGERLGCWSVALAQIMYYHRLNPRGSVSYKTDDYGWIQENFNNHVFNWNQIVPDLEASTVPDNETALYCYYAACAVQKNFGGNNYIGVSTTQVDDEAEDHYNCTAAAYSTNSYSLDELEAKIKYELQRRRPVWLYLQLYNSSTGGKTGHAVVVDEYEGSGQNFKIHINLGWGGDNPLVNFRNDSISPTLSYDTSLKKTVVTIRPN